MNEEEEAEEEEIHKFLIEGRATREILFLNGAKRLRGYFPWTNTPRVVVFQADCIPTSCIGLVICQPGFKSWQRHIFLWELTCVQTPLLKSFG